MRFRNVLCVTAACTLLAGCQPQITGLYSTMAFGGGEVHGVEIFIVRGRVSAGSPEGYFAYMQCANGKPGRPIVVPVSVVSDDITIPDISGANTGCPASEFHGSIAPSGISGQFGSLPTIELPRRESVWQ
jgi:hypothetical protein